MSTEAAEEKAIAEACRSYVDVYSKVVHGLTPQKHHQLWLSEIVPLITGRTEHKGLLIVAPPGHGKSSYISQVIPTWYLGHFPEQSLLFLTSSDVMAVQFHTTVRLTLEGEPHQKVFPQHKARPDVKRGWSADGLYLLGTPVTGKDYAYRSVGYGASVIGARAHGIILDDPLTQQKATSEIEQEKAKAYYDMTLSSRLVPGGWTLAIMTRWHEKDLASHLAAKPHWKTMTMPAISLDGRALWPDYFTIEFLRDKLKEIGTPLFNCLPGETRVAYRGLRRAYRRHYQGWLTEITTASGYQLTATPNHPVLTGRGWLPIGQIVEGDEVVYRPRLDRRGGPAAEEDIDRVDPTIAEVFDLAAHARAPQACRGTRYDFHGDGRDEQVEMVSAMGASVDYFEAALAQGRDQGDLFAPDAEMTSPGDIRPVLLSVADATPEAAEGHPARTSGLGVGAGGKQLGLRYAPCSYPELPQLVDDGRSVNAVPDTDGLCGFSAFVSMDKVILVVHDRSYDGYVYNLETEDHVYYSNFICTRNCLFQGDPSSLGGSVFRESSWFKPLPADLYVEDMNGDSPIDRLRIVQFWDLAFSERDLSDYTAGATMGLDTRGRCFLLDMVRGRWSPTETLEAMVAAASEWKPQAVGVEIAAFRQRAVNDILSRFRRRVIVPAGPIRIAGQKTSKDDVTRALLPAARAEAGMLYVDHEASWYPDFLKECLSFPNGAYDDQVDALAGATQMLASASLRAPVREIRYIGPGGQQFASESNAGKARKERRREEARARLVALGLEE